MKSTVNGAATVYIGNYLEWSGSQSTMKQYYYAGNIRVAMRTGNGTGTSGLIWLLGDHLGSTSVAANADGTLNSRQGYKPWGEQRGADFSRLLQEIDDLLPIALILIHMARTVAGR